ncbi:MAG: hypothetical protein ACI4D5_06835, partial [Kineothrix sp.]
MHSRKWRYRFRQGIPASVWIDWSAGLAKKVEADSWTVGFLYLEAHFIYSSLLAGENIFDKAIRMPYNKHILHQHKKRVNMRNTNVNTPYDDVFRTL